MKISYNWLKEYINIELPAVEVGEILTDIGLEVEEIIEDHGVGNGLKGLVVGYVKSTEKHPDADRLKVTKVDIGGGEELQIVCGAANVAEGQKVVVATVGSTLYPVKGEPFKITKAKIRGVESFGMICAEDEIGLGESHEGIIVLPESTPTGKAVSQVYGVKSDQIFEIGLTPNRSDAMGHIGVARDLQAALTSRTGKDISYHIAKIDDPVIRNTGRTIRVTVEDTEACPRYTGILMEGIKVSDSPEWLQARLRSIGLRPINNVVDVTNYILAEYGQPLHAFDADKISGGHVIVKKLPTGTEFKALDESVRKLNQDDLMICDEKGGMCIAGVFGGLDSGVSSSTTAIFLESACFNPISIRKTAGRHNLRTDAAQKFEKGTDPNHTVQVLKRAVQMLERVAGGHAAAEIVDVYPNPIKPFEVWLSWKNLNRLIGIEIDQEQVKTILRKLEIKVETEKTEGLNLLVPPFKVDVRREADVIEEVLRIYGVNNIPFPEQLRTSLASFPKPDKESINQNIATILTGNGFYEIFTNSITNSKYSAGDESTVTLLNSLNVGLDAMRTTMLPTGLEAISYNLNRQNKDLKFFEFGTTYHKDGDWFNEVEHLALYLTGFNQQESWRGANRRQVDLYLLKSYITNILQRLGIAGTEVAELKDGPYEYGLTITKKGTTLVTLGKISPKELKQFDIKQEIFYADLNWTELLAEVAKVKVKYQPVPKFPGVRRDLALLLDKSVNYSEVEKIALQEVKSILKSVHLFDKYEDPRLGDQKKSYAVSYFFEDNSKTLTDADVDKVMEKLIARYKSALNAEIR